MPKLRALGATLFVIGAPSPASADACVPAVTQAVTSALVNEVDLANSELIASWQSGDPERLAHLFAPGSVIMPEHQQRLFGPEQARNYYAALFPRLRITGYSAKTADIVAFDNHALEWGTFEVTYGPEEIDAPQTLPGKYMHLWQRQPGGSLSLKAQTWGFLAPLGDAAAQWMVDAPSAPVILPQGDAMLRAELDALNKAAAEAVKTHSTARIDEYAQDAVYLPYADRPYVGLNAIRSHLVPYIEAGRGATFDSVRVWNDGFEAIGGYVVEYSNFEVSWRAGEASGVTSGGGLRLLRREADCSLSLLRQAGIHHRP